LPLKGFELSPFDIFFCAFEIFLLLAFFTPPVKKKGDLSARSPMVPEPKPSFQLFVLFKKG